MTRKKSPFASSLIRPRFLWLLLLLAPFNGPGTDGGVPPWDQGPLSSFSLSLSLATRYEEQQQRQHGLPACPLRSARQPVEE